MAPLVLCDICCCAATLDPKRPQQHTLYDTLVLDRMCESVFLVVLNEIPHSIEKGGQIVISIWHLGARGHILLVGLLPTSS